MGHARVLLDAIAAQLEADWPRERHEYVYEAPLVGNGTLRMLPDIQVVADGKVVCAVEIGYTRPEKLTRYRALGIPDVRWYAKDGTLHTEAPARRVVLVRREERVRPAPSARFRQLVMLRALDCARCYEAAVDDALADLLESCARHEDEADCGDGCPAPREWTAAEREAERALLAEAEDGAHSCCTFLMFFSNGRRWLGLLFCDHCGESYCLDEFERDVAVDWESAADFDAAAHRYKYSPDERERRRLIAAGERPADDPFAKYECSYEEVVAIAKDVFGLAVTYDDFPWWRE